MYFQGRICLSGGLISEYRMDYMPDTCGTLLHSDCRTTLHFHLTEALPVVKGLSCLTRQSQSLFLVHGNRVTTAVLLFWPRVLYRCVPLPSMHAILVVFYEVLRPPHLVLALVVSLVCCNPLYWVVWVPAQLVPSSRRAQTYAL